MTTEAPSLGLLLHDAARLVRKRFEARSAAFGLTSAQWRMLLHVCNEGVAPQSRLAELLEIEPISVSRLLDRMEALEWVTRADDPGDRRVRLVLPTQRALQVFDHIRTIADAVYAEALKGMSETARQDMVAGLSCIINNLSDEVVGDDPASP